MSIRFQYNKTSLQQQVKQLRIRVRALPTLKSKESALRVEVKKTKDLSDHIEEELTKQLKAYDEMLALWGEFDTSLLQVRDVHMSSKKIAGVLIPTLEKIDFEIKPFSLTFYPHWYMEGMSLMKSLAELGIEAEFTNMKLQLLEYARKKTTQKVNLFEKVQIPGYEDAIRKIKRYLEDEESLSKAAQKIMREHIEQNEKEVAAL